MSKYFCVHRIYWYTCVHLMLTEITLSPCLFMLSDEREIIIGLVLFTVCEALSWFYSMRILPAAHHGWECEEGIAVCVSVMDWYSLFLFSKNWKWSSSHLSLMISSSLHTDTHIYCTPTNRQPVLPRFVWARKLMAMAVCVAYKPLPRTHRGLSPSSSAR